MSKTIFIKHLLLVGPKMKNAYNSLKFGTLDTSNTPISILLSKIIPIRFLPAVMRNKSQE